MFCCPVSPRKDQVYIKRIEKVNPAELAALYQHVGWLESRDQQGLDWIPKLLSASLCCFGAFYRGRLVGFGRAISDGVSDAYIQDVMVQESFRGKGLGRKIVKAVLSEVRKREIAWIGLIASPGTEAFYQHLGFSALNGHIPMLFKG